MKGLEFLNKLQSLVGGEVTRKFAIKQVLSLFKSASRLTYLFIFSHQRFPTSSIAPPPLYKPQATNNPCNCSNEGLTKYYINNRTATMTGCCHIAVADKGDDDDFNYSFSGVVPILVYSSCSVYLASSDVN